MGAGGADRRLNHPAGWRYICAYYMLVNQARLVFWSTTSKLEENVTAVYPECKWMNFSSFFAPIHKIDRQLIRPKWWAPDVSRYPIDDGVPRISD